MGDGLQKVINPTCAMESLRRHIESGDEHVREFMAPAMFLLSCGHKRPTNSFEPMNAPLDCYVCGTATIVAITMLDEPQWFPHPDALIDLATPA